MHPECTMRAARRQEELSAFARREGTSIVANARLLATGVDVPAVDMVVFADPKQSQIEIRQVMARAARRYAARNPQYRILIKTYQVL